MIVMPTGNECDIKAVLGHPDIWPSISSDLGVSADEFDWTLFDGWLAICAYVDSRPIGIALFHSFMDGDEVHFQVLPEFRDEYAIRFADEAAKYARMPLYAVIPAKFHNVVRFAEKVGFEIVESGEKITMRRCS